MIKDSGEKIDMSGAYWEVQAVLDEELGTEEGDGAGQGIAADVRLAISKAEARGYQHAIDALRDSERQARYGADRAIMKIAAEFLEGRVQPAGDSSLGAAFERAKAAIDVVPAERPQ